MSGRYGLGLMSQSREFSRMQDKLDNLYDNYNVNSSCTNISKTTDLIEDNANIQKKLYGSLENIAAESCTKSILKPPCTYYKEPTCYASCCYPFPSYPCTSVASAAAAAIAATTQAAINSDLAVRRTLTRKNAEIIDISNRFKKDISELEEKLNSTKLENGGLKYELDETKQELISERVRAHSMTAARDADISDLKEKLQSAETKLGSLEPRAELALELEKQILLLKDEIRCIKTSNAILADQNCVQAAILRSRPASPCFLRARSPSPCRLSRPASACSVKLRATSPCAPSHCTQLIRQDLLTKRFDDLYSRDRLAAMDCLRAFSDNYENNQRIIFAAVQGAFSAAKKAFCDWKIRVRSTVAITHCGPETLEEAVQSYINRNVDLYDLPSMVSQVIISLNCNPKIRLPLGVSYSVISTFIREACRTAWEMSALAFPLDTAFALDAEVFDENRYRRSYDSEYSAPLINHHIWPCLMQGVCVLARGEACTKRGASLYIRPSSPIRCSRNRSKSPCPKSILRSRSYYCH